MTRMNEVPDPGRPVGLRERKKARTRAAIREHALRLFREQGYTATTVEQIAAAADVSPATFFRYFPTKEDVVLQDDFDLITLAALERQPPELNPIAAFRAAAAESYGSMSDEDMARFQETTRLGMTVPEIRARSVDELLRTIDMISDALARRSGRDPDDFGIRVLTGAIIGVVITVTMPWTNAKGHHGAGHHEGDLDEMFARIDAGLAELEQGFHL
jgi:AcrR family transcriptional regulator